MLAAAVTASCLPQIGRLRCVFAKLSSQNRQMWGWKGNAVSGTSEPEFRKGTQLVHGPCTRRVVISFSVVRSLGGRGRAAWQKKESKRCRKFFLRSGFEVSNGFQIQQHAPGKSLSTFDKVTKRRRCLRSEGASAVMVGDFPTATEQTYLRTSRGRLWLPGSALRPYPQNAASRLLALEIRLLLSELREHRV